MAVDGRTHSRTDGRNDGMAKTSSVTRTEDLHLSVCNCHHEHVHGTS